MTMKLSDYKQLHDEVIRMFDLADEAMDVVEQRDDEHKELRYTLVKPVIAAVDKHADDLSDTLLTHVEKDCKVSPRMVKKSENAVRGVFSAVIGFVNELKQLPEELQSKLLSAEHEQEGAYKANEIFAKLVNDVEALIDGGPYQKEFRTQEKRLPALSVLSRAVRRIGVQAMLLARAFKVVGLIQNLNKVEPGAAQTGRVSKSREKLFADIISRSQPSHAQGVYR